MNELINKRVYIPFNGGSVYGEGIIRKTEIFHNNTHKYYFDGEKGRIYFSSLDDIHLKSKQINVMLSIDEFIELKTQKLIKQMFIGKVAEILGDKKTIELLAEATQAIRT